MPKNIVVYVVKYINIRLHIMHIKKYVKLKSQNMTKYSLLKKASKILLPFSKRETQALLI